MKDVTLPDKPSELIKIALKDLTMVENTPGYKIAMSSWHEPITTSDQGPVCMVCLAGSVIAGTFKALIGSHQSPATITADKQTRDKLLSLDWLRMGQIKQFLRYNGVPDDEANNLASRVQKSSGYLPIKNYNSSPEKFKKALCRVSQILEDEGY